MTAVATKFPRRRDGWYHLDDLGKFVSYSKVASIINKPALVPWAARTTATNILNDPETYDTVEKAVASIYATRDKAADRGSTVHSACEAIDLGASIDIDSIPDAFRGYVQAYLLWTQAMRPKILHTEANVYNLTHRYAGTTDLIAEIGGRVMLIDRKTGKDIYREASVQLCAYRHAEFILTHEAPPQRIPMPTIEGTAVVLLGEDGTYKYEETTFSFAGWIHLLEFWRIWEGEK